MDMSRYRIAGFFWLMTFITGSLALFGNRIIVANNATATAANILANESAYRLGIVTNLIAGLFYLAATVFVYDMLKPVHRNVSLTAAFFSLAGCAISGFSAALQFAPLVILKASQSAELALLFVRLNRQTFYVVHVFFGLHCLLVGWLILKSTFLPRFVGALMLFAGLGWLTMSLSGLLAPQFGNSLYPFILMPGMIGEATLCLWLLIAGVNVDRRAEVMA
jgi:hypothetical protein